MARKKPQRFGRCVYCGERRSLTDDHIPPKCLCPTPLPNDLLKIPSCEQCNRGASKDDEYLRTWLVLKEGAGDHPEAVQQRAAVFRSLDYPEARGLRRLLATSIRDAVTRTASGLYVRRTAYDVNLLRLDRVVERIVRGLFWHHYGRSLPRGYDVRVFSEHGLRGITPEMQREIGEQIVTHLAPELLHTLGRGVLAYKFQRTQDDENVTAWLLMVYEDVRFLALTGPAAG